MELAHEAEGCILLREPGQLQSVHVERDALVELVGEEDRVFDLLGAVLG